FELRKLARKLFMRFQTRDVQRAQPLMRQLGGVTAEDNIERLAEYGGIRLIYQPLHGSRRLKQILVLDRDALADVAEPGSSRLRQFELERARLDLTDTEHPQAEAIAEYLRTAAAEKLRFQMIRALAALARLVEAGDVMPARVFSV